jgi:3-mercaptopyruvate sulfurtransferase SseA
MRSWAAIWFLVVVPVWSQHAPSAADIEAGKWSYSFRCAQCHGDDGDAIRYSDVLPIAGIQRRHAPEVIAELSGKFSGRFLQGKDREQIGAYISTLRGAKGLVDPGWIISPYLLERKSPLISEFRIIDTRSKDDYAVGHIPNAVSANSGSCTTEVADTVSWLGELGVTPTTTVVVYDSNGGPSAACAWWRIRQAGHPWVAVLDGGWRRWTAERRATSTVVPRLQRSKYGHAVKYNRARAPVVNPSTLRSTEWSWEAALDDNGFHSSEELSRLVKGAGLTPGSSVRVSIPSEQVSHLLLTLNLLGYDADYNPKTAIVSVSERLR